MANNSPIHRPIYEKRRHLFLYCLSLLGIFSTVAYTAVGLLYDVNLADKTYTAIIVPVSILNVLILRYTDNDSIAAYLFVSIAIIVEFLLVYLTAVPNLFTLIILPVVTIFLIGKKKGVVISLLFLATVLALGIVNPNRSHIIFPNTTLIDICIIYLTTLFATYLFHDSTQKSEDLIYSRSVILSRMNVELQEEIQKRQEIERELKTRMDEVKTQKQESEAMNRSLVAREMEMIHLKAKIAFLRNKLY